MTAVIPPDVAPRALGIIDAWRQRIRAETCGNYSILMGVRLLCLGEAAVALSHFQKADTDFLRSPEVRYLLLRALEGCGQVAAAESLRQQETSNNPDFELQGLSHSLDRLATVQAYSDSVLLIRNAPENLRRNSSSIRARLIRLLVNQGIFDEAVDEILDSRRSGIKLEGYGEIQRMFEETRLQTVWTALGKRDWEKLSILAEQAVVFLGNRIDTDYLLARAQAGSNTDSSATDLFKLVSFLTEKQLFTEANIALADALPHKRDFAEIQALSGQVAAALQHFEQAAKQLFTAKQAGASPSRLAQGYKALFTKLTPSLVAMTNNRQSWPLARICEVAANWTDHAPAEQAAWMGRGRALLLARHMSEAAEAYARADMLDPDGKTLARLYLGFAYLALRKFDDAADAFGRLLSQPEYAVQYATWLGLAKQAQGSRAEAVELHNTTASGKVECGYGWSNLGLVYLLDGDLSAAREALLKAFSFADAPKSWILFIMGSLENRLGRPDEADRLFTQAYESEPVFSCILAKMLAWAIPEAAEALDRLELLPPL